MSTTTIASASDARVHKTPLIVTGCLTAAVIPLSIAGPAVVVPSINQALGGSAVELNWIINAYILTYGSATLAAGSLADTYGRKRVNVGVLSGIGLAIAAAGLAWLGLTLSGDAQSARLLAMLVIGIGIGLPWGLMDGLAVSVVPKERAGMAAGIFNAVRLAGDGMAIAAVGALMSANIFSGLVASVPNGTSGQVANADLVEASSRLAMSDLPNALVHLPTAGRSLLLQVYEDAFRFQLLVLAGAAAATAILVLLLLGRVRRHD